MKSVHLLTATSQGVQHWAGYQHHVTLMFEVFGELHTLFLQQLIRRVPCQLDLFTHRYAEFTGRTWRDGSKEIYNTSSRWTTELFILGDCTLSPITHSSHTLNTHTGLQDTSCPHTWSSMQGGRNVGCVQGRVEMCVSSISPPQ